MLEPKEVREVPGFFEIPGFERYGISKEGLLLDKETTLVRAAKRWKDGYYQHTMIRHDGKYTISGRHRLLALAFIHPGTDVSALIVNHLDGIPGNDWIENLEWTTYRGNIEHAGAMGLTSKCIPFSLRDPKTGKVEKWPSAVSYGRTVGLTRDAVLWRIRVGETRVFPEGKQYRRGHGDEPWYIPTKADEHHMGRRRVLVKFLDTGVELEYACMTDAQKALGFTLTYFWKKVEDPSQPVLPGNIQVKWSDDNIGWRPVGDLRLELERSRGRKTVVVINEETGERRYFDNVRQCAKALNLLVTTLHNRMQCRGTRIYDGHRFFYYSDLVQGPVSEETPD